MAFHGPATSRPSRSTPARLDTQSPGCLRAGGVGEGRAATKPACRQADAIAARYLRLDRLAADAGRTRRLPRRSYCGCLRATGGSPVMLASFRRALGAALARCGTLCGDRWLQARPVAARSLA